MIQTSNSNTKDFFENSVTNLSISESRKELLKTIAKAIVSEMNKGKKVNVNFICTHNSRRSQLAQVWSFYAINYFGLKNISSFSGGTEVTAFHRNTVLTLREVGFQFNVIDFDHQNPTYNITFEGGENSILGFSKIYDNNINKSPFFAVTTCNNADENCPFIPEALERFHLPFKDPKVSDGTTEQQETYLAANKAIAAEIFTIFKTVKNLLN